MCCTVSCSVRRSVSFTGNLFNRLRDLRVSCKLRRAGKDESREFDQRRRHEPLDAILKAISSGHQLSCCTWTACQARTKMATGDVRGNFERLKLQLRSISYPHALDPQGCKDGLPASILPLIHYALLGYSRHVARYLSVNGYVLYAKSDLRFVECVIKLLRKEFEYRCPLTVAQIFARGFAEKKFLFVHDLIQMCKRKHNDLLRVVRNSQKHKPRECQTKAFGRILHHSQRRPIIRNKHLSSKFDRRCELDLLPDSKCREICSRSACQENSWVVPEDGRTRLSDVVDKSEEPIRASIERTKEHGLRVLTRSKDHNVDERCHMHHVGSRPTPNFSPTRTAMMGAQTIHREHGYGSLPPDPDLQERDHDHDEPSPIPSPGFIRPKQGNISGDDYPSVCPTTSAPEEDSNTRRRRDLTNSEFTKDRNFKSASIHDSHNHNIESFEGTVSGKNAGGQTQTSNMQENLCPYDHLHEDQLSGPEDIGRQNVSTHTTADDLPQAVWQKIMDLSGKVDSCFCSLDSKIAHSFNSLDEKLEMKFKYLDEGVTCTRETLQDKLSVLENRIVQLERTSQISPMSFQSNVTFNDDNHPIRDITNTFNNSVDNLSWRNFTGLQSTDPLVYYPNMFQQQDIQYIQKIPIYAGLLAANTQDFIANVRARFHQTKEMLHQK